MTSKGKSLAVDEAAWTFLSNHAHVFLCIASETGIRLRDVAAKVGITERAVQRIVADLEAGAYLTRERIGRRNRYVIHADRPLRHPLESHRDVRRILDLLPLAAGEVTHLDPEDGLASELASSPSV